MNAEFMASASRSSLLDLEQETFVMNKWIMTMVYGLALGIGSAKADETKGSEQAEAAHAAAEASALAQALKTATISLQAGLKASESQGTPISGKFEIDDGKLQLSIYVTKAGKFFELIVDHQTGKVIKATPITEGEDLAHATKQADAMAKAKGSLRDAVGRAEKANSGYHAVRAIAEIEEGTSMADVDLLKGTLSKSVDEAL